MPADVAQIFNLLYRRIAFGQALFQHDVRRITNPRYSRIQFCVTLAAAQAFCSAAWMRSGVMGNWSSRAPVRSYIALAITAPMRMMAGSPPPCGGEIGR